jgi:hypothetical protein
MSDPDTEAGATSPDDVVSVATYLTDALERGEIDLADAEAALFEWSRDPSMLHAAVAVSSRADVARLLDRATIDA